MQELAKAKRPELRMTELVGWWLILSGFFHLGVWIFCGGDWAGSISWRKPILFGISGGVTVLSLGWVAGKLQRRVRDKWWLRLFSLAMLIEVGLITLQQWRGVPSHFNRETPLDAVILTGIEILITIASVVILDLTYRCFSPINAARDMVLAIRAGMLLLVLGCALGFAAQAVGSYQQSLHQSTETYGKSGVLKFPHGIPLHAIQFLPAVAWGLARLGADKETRYHAVKLSTYSIVLFTLYGCVQTIGGRARFELSISSTILLCLSVGLLIYPAAIAGWRILGAVHNAKRISRAPLGP